VADLTVNSGYDAFKSYMKNSVPSLVTFDFQSQLDDLRNPALSGDTHPTILSSSLIALADDFGRTIRFEGSGFGPITSSGTSQTILDAFLDAIKKFDGSATGTLNKIIFADNTTELFRLTVTPTAWTFVSGTESLTITGQLPTSLAQVNLAIDEILDLATYTLDPNYNPATSSLVGFTITNITGMSDGNVVGSMTFSQTNISVKLGEYTLDLQGAFPANFGDAGAIVLDLFNGIAPANVSLTSVILTHDTTHEVVFQVLGATDYEEMKSILAGLANEDVSNGSNGQDHLDYSGSGPVNLHGGSGSDELIGGNGADFLFGETDDDTLNGGGGSDILDGGSGSDILKGGEGDDYIIFDAADSATNVDGGNGDDTLVVKDGGSVPTGFNLVGSHFEKAKWVQTDVGNLQTWSTINSDYDDAWHLLNQKILNDDLTSYIDTYDILNAGSWGKISDYVDANNAIDSRNTTLDDGSSNKQFFDHQSNQTWSSISDGYDSSNRLINEVTNHDNGSHDALYLDASGANGWSTIYDNFSAANNLTNETIVYDAGNRTSEFFDHLIVETWVSVLQTYVGANLLTRETTNYDDSTRQENFLDAQGNQNWTNINDLFDGNGVLKTETTNYDTGARQVYYADYLNTNPWASITDNYDLANRLDTELVRNDDNSYSYTDYDQGLANTWASDVLVYDTAQVLTQHYRVMDNGSIEVL
jgi:Ca2+-binding RTX toxin-like protein